MEIKEEIKLSEYLSDKRNYRVNLLEDYVQWKNEAHKIVYKKDIPYVQIREILKLSEIKEMVKTVIKPENKSTLKNMLFVVNGNNYIIDGIGGESIKVIKNGNMEPVFLRYIGTNIKNIEAQELLEEMYNYISS